MSTTLPTVAEVHDVMHRVNLTMRDAAGAVIHAPLSVVPQHMPRATLATLPSVMPLFNAMTERIARDFEYLVSRVGPTDQFSQKLAEIIREVYMTPGAAYQPLMLGLLRSDYLFDSSAPALSAAAAASFERARVPVNAGWKQVEINTIASSFPALSSRCGQAVQQLYPAEDIAASTSERDVVTALERAHRHFCNAYPMLSVAAPAANNNDNNGSSSSPIVRPCVVFVVQPGERNVGDQGLLRSGLEALGVCVVRKSIVDLDTDLLVDPVTRQCSVSVTTTTATAPEATTTTRRPVSIFYFRALYDWKEYEDHPCAWAVRRRIEATMAVKCPSAPFHMCTWKSIQQHLFAEDALLRKFSPDADEAQVLRNFMVPHYELSHVWEGAATERGRAIRALVDDAIARPQNWVVKTLREGWGFILEGDRMKQQLEALVAAVAASASAAAAAAADLHTFAQTHLLVYRIRSPSHAGAMMRAGVMAQYADLESELGTYGAIFSDGHKVLFNVECGYLLRTKSKSQQGGGVMSGVASLDVVALT